MNQITKRLDQAIEIARAMPPEHQDLVAAELLDRVRALSAPPEPLTAAEQAELASELAAAKRGEFANEADVAAMFAKHGI